ncbi:MAG: MmcQ/YjbR family DNA-binding protein [Gemmiger sp.]
MTWEQFPELDRELLANPGAVRDFKAEWGWDRYQVGGRLFAAFCRPGEKYDPRYAGHPLLTFKVDPAEGEFLRAQYPDILPGFYCDKRHWISVRLDGSVPAGELFRLCHSSYALVFARLTKKAQREILAGSQP